MADIERIRCPWSGFPGAPGVSTFYATDAILLRPKLKTFFDAVKAYLPSNVTINYDGAGDRIDEFTGQLTGSWSTAAALAPTVGSLGQVYAAPVGMCVNWITATILHGRRLRGRTFLVPVQQDTATGVPNPLAITAIQNAANALAGSELLVWSRPTKPPLPARPGGSGPVTSAKVSPKYVVLRSRRD
jgi:hypothetical protein